MIETQFLVADRLLPAPELHAALGRLAASGWRAALAAARQAFLESAHVSQPFAAAAALLPGASGDDPRPPAAGDLLFRGDDLFYVITKPRGRATWRPPAAAAPAPPEAAINTPELEIGLISPTRSSASSRLADFAARVTEALRQGGGAAELAWRRPAIARLEALRGRGEWRPPRASLADFERAQVAVQPLARHLLERLQQEGFAREADLLATADPEPMRLTLAGLQGAQLIRRDWLIRCHLSRRPLLLLAAPAQQQSEAVMARQCPDCGLGFGDETLEAVIQAQPAASGETPPWPLLWLSEHLNRLGTLGLLWHREAPELAPWRIAAGEFAGRVWAWAVAAQPVEEDQARALDRLRRRFALERLGVIALAGLGAAARAWFAAAQPPAVVAESFAAAEPLLESTLGDAALRYAAARLRPLEDSAGFPLMATLRALYAR
ncbi:MAG: hypothetical protein ACRD2H_15455 [Terriglobales bacterium]